MIKMEMKSHIKTCMFCKDRSAVHYYKNGLIYYCNCCIDKGAKLIKMFENRK